MKAWRVTDKWEMDFGSEIVFAETRGQAIVIALGSDNFEGAEFLDLKAVRDKQFDKYYKPNKTHMEWYNDDDRIALVKCGFYCNPDYLVESEDCPYCCAQKFCSHYQDYLEECKEEENV